MQGPQHLAVADQLDIADVGAVVRAFGLADSGELEGVASHRNGVAHGHAHILLGFIAGHHGDADRADCNADVGDVHAPERPGDGLPPGGVLEVPDDVQHRRQHDPQRQAQPQRRPGRPGAGQQRQGAPQKDGHQGRGAQLARQFGDAVALPAGKRAYHHEDQDRHHDRNKHGVEVGRAHRQLAQVERIDDQRVQRAQQHRGGCRGHEDVVDQQEGFTRDQGERAAGADLAGPHGKQRERAAHHDKQKNQDEDAAPGVGGKGVDRGQHPRPDQEGAQQAERERRDGQDDGPVAEQAAFLGNRQRVDERHAHQPGQERGVFHRVPEPPATPAQFVISPPRTQGDAQGQKHPGCRGPGARPAGPRGIEAPVEQGGNGKGKRHGQADIAHVQHRGMEHQTGVLQQGVEVAPVGRDVDQAQERVRGDQHEQQKAHRHQPQDTQDARDHGVGQLPREQ